MSGRQQDQVELFLAGADTPATAIAALLAIDEPCGTCLLTSPPVIASIAPPRGWNDVFFSALITALRTAHGPITQATPPNLLAGAFTRGGNWIEINLGDRAGRLKQITFARSIFDGEMLFAFSNLDRPRNRLERPTIAIGLWSHFTRTAERVGSWAGDERDGLAAEIAQGVVVRRYFVTATIDGLACAVSTTDPIAAELVGRAMLAHRSTSFSDDAVPPWETPLIQHATELKLGVNTPTDIRLQTSWQGISANANRFARLVTALSDSIALPLTSATDVPTRSSD